MPFSTETLPGMPVGMILGDCPRQVAEAILTGAAPVQGHPFKVAQVKNMGHLPQELRLPVSMDLALLWSGCDKPQFCVECSDSVAHSRAPCRCNCAPQSLWPFPCDDGSSAFDVEVIKSAR